MSEGVKIHPTPRGQYSGVVDTENEVAARNACGARVRFTAAGFPVIKTAEDFDFTAQPAITDTDDAEMASGPYLVQARNIDRRGTRAPDGCVWPQP